MRYSLGSNIESINNIGCKLIQYSG